jgi:AraC-like DNA-binding protein
MEDQFTAWLDLMVKAICSVDVESDAASNFHVETRLLEIGNVRLWPTTIQSMNWKTTPATPEPCHRSRRMPRPSSISIGQAEREASHGPYERYIVDASPPWACVGGRTCGIGLEVPRKLVPLPLEAVERLSTRRLPGQEGIGAVLAQFLTSLAQQAGSLRPCDAPHLETVVTDLLAATISHCLEADDDRRAPQAGLQTRIQARPPTLTRGILTFILRHLGDPELTPGSVASAHHISVSYLHRLFRAEGTTVAAWIRQRRLEAAQRDLADPALRTMPVHGIATRWGFTHHASFTRAFRTAYGLSPREYRRVATRRGRGG